MKAKSLKEIRLELQHLSQQELMQLCLQLARFKAENKELLTYELFYSHNKERYTNEIKENIEQAFDELNPASYFYLKKGVQKIQRQIKKYIRIAKDPEVEVLLLLYFLKHFKNYTPNLLQQKVLNNMYHRELDLVKKRIEKLHPDLQYDFNLALEELIL